MCLLPAMSQAQQAYYRPLHLQDMVKAVGTNTDALHVSDGEGDPNGAIIVGWRSGGRLFQYS